MTKNEDAARLRKLGRDALDEIIRTGRSDDHIAALGEFQRCLDQHYGQR